MCAWVLVGRCRRAGLAMLVTLTEQNDAYRRPLACQPRPCPGTRHLDGPRCTSSASPIFVRPSGQWPSGWIGCRRRTRSSPRASRLRRCRRCSRRCARLHAMAFPVAYTSHMTPPHTHTHTHTQTQTSHIVPTLHHNSNRTGCPDSRRPAGHLRWAHRQHGRRAHAAVVCRVDCHGEGVHKQRLYSCQGQR
jgi:hypothetical protein